MIGAVAACAFLVSFMVIRDKGQSTVLSAAFTLRVAVSIVHSAGIPLPDSQFDARTFEQVAWIWARDGRFFDDFTTGSYLYSWLNSGIYLIFRRDPFLLRVHQFVLWDAYDLLCYAVGKTARTGYASR